MTAIKKVKDKEGTQFFPVTHERAVRDDNGTTLETKLQNINSAINTTIPNQITQIGTNLEDLNCVVTGDYFTESVTAGSGYSYMTRKGRYFALKNGIPYSFTFTSESALTAPVYIRLMLSETDNDDYIVQNNWPVDTDEFTFTYTPTQDYLRVFIGYGSANSVPVSVDVAIIGSILERVDKLEQDVDEGIQELTVSVHDIDLYLRGFEIKDSLGNAERKYYRIPSIENGKKYTMAITINQTSTNPFYWTLYTEPSVSSRVVAYGTIIPAGELSASKTFTSSDDFESVYLMTYTGGDAGGFEFSLKREGDVKDKIESLEATVDSNNQSIIRRVDAVCMGKSTFDPSQFIRAAIYGSGVPVAVKYNVSLSDIHHTDKELSVHINEGFRFLVALYNSDGTHIQNTAWSSESITIPEDSYYRIRIERVPVDTSETADIVEFSSSIYYNVEETKDKDLSKAFSINPFARKRILHHINVEATNSDIPSESLHDIFYAKVSGADMIEANVKKCSDGVYVVKHGGQGGTLGAGLTFADDTMNSDILFSDVSSTALREKVRYNTSISRFGGYIPTLDEFCSYANEVGMMVCLQCIDENVLPIARKYLTDDRILAYGISSRGDFGGMITSYNEVTSVEQALGYGERYGYPYIHCWKGLPQADEELVKSVVCEMHKNGYMVSGAYVNSEDIERLFSLGVDMISSTFMAANELQYGNMLNVFGCSDSHLVIAGSVLDSGTITMQDGGTVTISDPSYAEGYYVCTARVKYTGKVNLCVSSSAEDTYRQLIGFESDGGKYVTLTNASQRSATLLRIKSVGQTTIEDIQFLASRVL